MRPNESKCSAGIDSIHNGVFTRATLNAVHCEPRDRHLEPEALSLGTSNSSRCTNMKGIFWARYRVIELGHARIPQVTSSAARGSPVLGRFLRLHRLFESEALGIRDVDRFLRLSGGCLHLEVITC